VCRDTVLLAQESRPETKVTALTEVEPIDIRPEVSVLGVFKHLNYRAWFAIAEFVDNAIQSFLDKQDELATVAARESVLRVRVRVESFGRGLIRVTDNAAGIFSHEWARALRPAEPPPDTTGLAEFGMGMKTAAAWFGRNLTIRSTAIGEPFGHRAELDFDKIIDERVQTIEPELYEAEAHEHGTLVEVSGLHKPLAPTTIAKVKSHLASIYRVFLRDGSLKISFQAGNSPEEELQAPEVKILTAPRFDEPDGPEQIWRKEIEFDFGEGLCAHGFVALRETGSTARAGLALFRRKRLIVGSDDETYRPHAIFGASNTYPYQRIFGELTLVGFDVSHTKDGFRWDAHEEAFVELLREHINDEPLPLIRQANRYRAETTRPSETGLTDEARRAVSGTVDVLEREIHRSRISDLRPDEETPPDELGAGTVLFPATTEFTYRSQRWRVTVDISDDPSPNEDWLERAMHTEQDADGEFAHVVHLRMFLRHPFSQRYAGAEYENLEVLVRIATAIVIAELTARQAGAKFAGEVRRRFNELLRVVFSRS
jgi:hypothetical protein